MSPPLYARFKNGLVYGFIKGNVSTVEELGEEKTAEWIAKKLAKWHQVTLPEEEGFSDHKNKEKQQKLWKTMYSWLDQGKKREKNVIVVLTHIKKQHPPPPFF
jgi:ethanolamine kinase